MGDLRETQKYLIRSDKQKSKAVVLEVVSCTLLLWPGGVMVRMLVRLATQRVAVQLPAVPLSGNNLRQVVHTRMPLSRSSINWYRSKAMMPYGWEGNRRSGVALAMRYRL